MSNAIYVIFCAALLALAACNDDEKILHGYVEGEYVYLAPTTSGILKTLSVRRGDSVTAGQSLFTLDETPLKAAIAAAEAEAGQAQANLKNILKGKRSEEMSVIAKQQEQAKAKLDNAQKEFERAKLLIADNAISRTEYDRRKSEYEMTQANVDELSAQLKVAAMGARSDEISAAQALVELSEQKLIQAKQQWIDAAPKAESHSYVENAFFRVGEFVAAGKPVVSLLPPENIKVRFFVSQKKLPTLALDQKAIVTCDGCGEPVVAKITYIASQAEYTPPVIYSTESRKKLVFMVEATPDAPNAMLRPGLPVDIEIHTP